MEVLLFTILLTYYKIKLMTLLESEHCLCLSLLPGIFHFLPIPFSFCPFGTHPPFSTLSPFQPFPLISFSLCLSPGDSWLDITAQDLERMLQERSGGRADVGSRTSSSTKRTQHVGVAEERRKEAKGGEEEEEAGYSLVAVSQGMKNFLNAVSSHEGAELPW